MGGWGVGGWGVGGGWGGGSEKVKYSVIPPFGISMSFCSI